MSKTCTIRWPSVVLLIAGLLLSDLGLRYCAAQDIPPNVAAPGHPAADVQDPPSDHSTERFDELSLKGSNLRADQPLPGEKDAAPKYTRELLRVQWRHNDPIDLYVIRPKGVSKPPVVLFLYSFPSEADRFRSDELCERFVSDGFAAVGFVSAMTGQRYHDTPLKEWFVSQLPQSLVTSVHDVQMVLNYLSSRGDFDMDRVGMFGQGSGGTIAILSAGVDPRIKAIDVMDPWGDWPEWLALSLQVPESERAEYLTPEFLAGVASLDPVQWLDRLKGRPLRLQENLFNVAMPAPVRQRMEAALPTDSQLAEYQDKKDYVEKVSTNGRMLAWLHTALASPSRAPLDRDRQSATGIRASDGSSRE